MIKGIIFDMDGVLVDSQPIHFQADMDTLKFYGISVTQQMLEKYAGTSNENRWSKIKAEYHLEQSVEELIHRQVNIIFNLVEQSALTTIAGIIPLLNRLQKEEYKISVASSSSYDFIYKMLDKLKIREYFHYIISGEDMEHGKPAPDIFIHTAKVMELSPEECIVIEDSANGVLAAVQADMKCIAYINKNSGKQDLSRATSIIDDFHKIVQIDFDGL